MSLPKVMVVLLWAALSGLGVSCAGAGGSVYQRLQNEDPQVRMKAAIEAGQARDARAVPLLVDRLDDSDEDVRVVAILALQRITGKTLGYHYYEPSEARRQAVDRWRAYLESGAPASAPATAPASAPANAAVPKGGAP